MSKSIPPRTITSGHAALDTALGGGFAGGGVIEIHTEERLRDHAHALTFDAIRAVQKREHPGVAAFVDVAHTLGDLTCVAERGVDVASLLVSQPDTLSDALDIVNTLVHSGAVDLVVLGDVGEQPGGPFDVRRMRECTARAYRTGTTLLCLSEWRPNPEAGLPSLERVTSNAYRYFATQRIDIVKRFDRFEVRVIKNKLVPPFAKCTIDLT